MNGRAKWWVPFGGVTLSVVVVTGLGYFPTVRMAGAEALGAMLAGSAVGLAANWLGTASLFAASFQDPARRPVAVLTATTVRFAAVLVLALAVALSGWFERGVLLIWVAISHLTALFVETLWLVHATRNGIATDR